MLRSPWLVAGLVLTFGTVLAISDPSLLPWRRSSPDDAPGSIAAPVRAATGGTRILTVAVDSQGVRVIQSTVKPGLAFRAPKHADRLPFRWTLRAADGTELAAGGFDPARICLDPDHAGQAPHTLGDQVIPHLAHTNVKVPDVAGLASIEFELVDGAGRRAFGRVDAGRLAAVEVQSGR